MDTYDLMFGQDLGHDEVQPDKKRSMASVDDLAGSFR